ncbi:MAG: enolase C-terminal domain-like protein [Armatimonadota bacterium]|nr:enolase C-terminal domain-like protein [Armatimonadota bacterium]
MSRAIAWTRATLIERPTSNRLTTSYGDAPAVRPHVIVEIGTADGLRGLGEASPLPEFTGETAESVLFVLNQTYLAPLEGRDPAQVATIMADLDRALPGNTSAKAAIDMALHDLAGRLLGVPVSTLLGGARRASIRLARAVSIGSTADTVASAERHVAAGIRTIKMKVGQDPRMDVERVRAVRAAVGPDVRIRIDANQGFDPPTAIAVLRQLEDCDLEYVEQPVPRWNHAGMAHVRRATGVRVLADEAVHSPQDALNLIRAEAADLFAIKFVKTGGLARARQIAAIGEAAGMDCVVISPFETQVGAAAGLHMALALPYGRHAHELTVFATQPEMARTGIRLQGDTLVPSEGPGLGVESIVEIEPVAGRMP